MDRIIIDSDTDVHPNSFKLVGTEAPNPSDHFGVVVELK
jgi:endonuclease/exonuclease/phosphatase family metal-dependent hydrolase